MKRIIGLAAVAAVTIAAAPTDGPRAIFVRAAFATSSKPQAMQLVNSGLAQLDGILQRAPGDRMAQLQKGIGLGYRGQLTRGISDAKAGRDILAGLAKKYPNDPEVVVALGGWHTSVIGTVGGFIGSTVLGANKNTGLAYLDKAVALSGGRQAFYPAYDGMMRVRLDANDKKALVLLDQSARAPTPQELDKIFQANAKKVADRIRAGDHKGASALAEQLLPFGRIS